MLSVILGHQMPMNKTQQSYTFKWSPYAYYKDSHFVI